MSEIETKKKKKKHIQTISETKSRFFEKINKINKPLANLTKMRKEKIQINKIRNEKREIMTNIKEIQVIIRDYIEKVYLNKLENLEKMEKNSRNRNRNRGFQYPPSSISYQF
jgi:hypothetical protein